ncbi:MAG TPA: hypothetical protein VIK62_04635 [Verrucomicrobiae bacterium]
MAEPVIESPDSAMVFGLALSLWNECNKQQSLNLIEHYDGVGRFMREVMRVANQFADWSSLHIAFHELDEVWPCLLEDKFGKACLSVIQPTALDEFSHKDCLRVAMRLRLPIKPNDKLLIPIDVRVSNPISTAAFREFHIQAFRKSIQNGDLVPFSSDGEMYDDAFGHPYYSLYGVDKFGFSEHIADRKTYQELVYLAERFAPGVVFPQWATFFQDLHEAGRL